MKNYKSEILNYFVDRLENSSFYKGKSDKKRKISLPVSKLFSEYGKSDSFKETELIENSIQELLDMNFVVLGKNKEFGNKDIILNDSEETIENMYSYLGRVSLKLIRNDYLDVISKINGDGFIKEFLNYIIRKTELFDTSDVYLELYNIKELYDIIHILEMLEKQEKEISFRKFSILVFRDSKKLDLYKNKVFKIVRDFYNDSIENEKEAFECFNVIMNPSYIYVKGDMVVSLNDHIIDIGKLGCHFAFSSYHVEHMEIIDVSASSIMTIENLTSFHDLEKDGYLLIYLGGFHNTLRRKFLLKIYNFLKEKVTYYHFGDIDAGGIYIYLDLINKTNIPFIPYKMDVETLQKYNDYTKVLTQNDRHRLNRLKEKYDNPIINYMLEHNQKLEQEIINIED